MNKALKDLLDAGTITQDDIKAACGEMDSTGAKQPEQKEPPKPAGLGGVIEDTQRSAFETACGEMFGGKSGADLIAAIKQAAQLAKAQGVEARIDKTVKAKVSGEMAQNLVKKMLHVPDDATEEQIAGEIDSVLADDTVKAFLAQSHIDTVPPAPQGGNDGNDASGFFSTGMTAL